ncbi:MAG: hypothetical protein DBX41_00400 [Clostridiales bacterium]|nr:MAG: hypothetical protein DBX41_00400 [Clostridiales bacterium]
MSNKMGKNEDLTLLSIIIVFALIFSTYTMIKAMNEAHKEANEMMKQGVYSNNSYYTDDYDSSYGYEKAENETDYETNYKREYATNNADAEWLINEIVQTDVIKSIGSTYQEIQNKHREIIFRDYYPGSDYIFFEFQDAPNDDYFFVYKGDTASDPPEDDAVCFMIITTADKLISSLGDGMDIDVFAQTLGENLDIYDNKTDNEHYVEGDSTKTAWFTLGNSGTLVTINMKKPDMISPTDEVLIENDECYNSEMF